MFKAVRKAGFNEKSLPTLKDTILVYEPEAAAYFTARDLKERGTDFLQVSAPLDFLRSSANVLLGGSLFHSVRCRRWYSRRRCLSSQESETAPRIREGYRTNRYELQFKYAVPLTISGRKCGSALIDTAFKEWLRGVIGKDRFTELDPYNAGQQRISPHTAESAAMRSLIRQFCSRKEAFTNQNRAPIKLDLPAPLDSLSIAGRVDQGELTLHWPVIPSKLLSLRLRFLGTR